MKQFYLLTTLILFVISGVSAAGFVGENPDLPQEVFSDEIDSFYLQEADVNLDEEGYLDAEMIVSADGPHPDVLLSPGWALPKEGALQNWIDQRVYQGYFSYSESHGEVKLPDQDASIDELKIHVTETNGNPCFGVMYGVSDCFDIEEDKLEFFESEIQENSNIEMANVDEEVNVFFYLDDFEDAYLTIRYPDVSPEKNLVEEAERSGNQLSVATDDLTEETICGYVYGAEIDCLEVEIPVQQSSNFECGSEWGENQYAFCTNQGEDAEKEIDLGHTTEPLNFVRNSYNEGSEYAQQGFSTVFVNSDSGQTLQFWEGYESTYKGAEIEIVEWRGLTDGHSEEQQVVIEVNTAAEPDASIDFGKTQYEIDEEIILDFEAFEPGEYNVEVSGGQISASESFTEDDLKQKLIYEATNEDMIEAELIAPGSWWNPLDSDKVIDEDTTEVYTPETKENYEFGDKITIEEGESTNIEGQSFYLTAVMSNGELLWRPNEDGDTNSPLSLRKPESMGFRYSDSDFDPQGYVCSLDTDSDKAEIIVKESKENPWHVCDNHPSDYRTGEGKQTFEMKEYQLGEKVTLREGEGLQFGESTAYLDEISEFNDRYMTDGYLEWFSQRPTWHPPFEGYSTSDYFYEGEISTATCETSNNEIEIVMEETDNIHGNAEWPEDWCQEQVDTEPIENGNVDINCEESMVERNDQVSCYLDNIENLDRIDSYEWSVDGQGQASDDQSVEHVTLTFTQEITNTEATLNYMAEDVNGVKASDSFNLELVPTTDETEQEETDQTEPIDEIEETPEEPIEQDSMTEKALENLPDEEVGEMIRKNIEVIMTYDISETGQIAQNEFEDALADSRVNRVTEEELAVVALVKKENINYIDYLEGSGRIELSNQVINPGETVNIKAVASYDVAENGYEVIIKNERGTTQESVSSIDISERFSYTPETPGNYKVQLRLKEGMLESIVSVITGSSDSVLVEKSILVEEEDQVAWRSYCSNEFDADTQGEQLQCVKDELSAMCFEDKLNDDCYRIGESVCQEIMGTSYISSERRCERP